MMKLVSSISATVTPTSHRILFSFRNGMTLRCSKQRDYSSQFPLRYVPKKARQPGADEEIFSVEDLGKRNKVGCFDMSISDQENARKLEVSVSPIANGYEKTKMGFLLSGGDTDEDADHDLLAKSDETFGEFENFETKEIDSTLQQGSSGSIEDAEKMAIKMLAQRVYTALELKKKLIAKRFTIPIIDVVLNDFRSRGLINDSLYAEAYSRSRWSSSTWGPRRIKQALFTKGINSSDIEKTVNLVFQEGLRSDEEDLKHGLSQASMDHLYAQASKQWLRSQAVNIEARKARIVRWLQYRGFNWSVISFILKKLECL